MAHLLGQELQRERTASLPLDGALSQADPYILRAALYAATGEAWLRDMEPVSKPIRGGQMSTFALTDQDEARVREATRAFLADKDTSGLVASRDLKVDARDVLEMVRNRALTEKEWAYAFEEAGFEAFPRDVAWNALPDADILANYPVLIVGAGVSGITNAIQMKRLGIPYRIVEAMPDLGGTWERARYPGAGVDTNCYSYQFRFENSFKWSEKYPSRFEMKKYLHHIANDFGINDHIRYSAELDAAEWSEDEKLWNVVITSGDETLHEKYRFILACTGFFSVPNVPHFEGIENFRGTVVHSTKWDDAYDYTGQRVAVIGNGSSGAQMMPVMAEKAGHLTTFLRTPTWIMPVDDYKGRISAEHQWMFDNMPFYRGLFVYNEFAATHAMEDLQVLDRDWIAKGGKVNEKNDRFREICANYIRTKLASKPELIQKCMPTYAPLARRNVVDNGWYDALLRDNVELVNDAIVRFEEDGIVTADGRRHLVDLVVLATGYRVSDHLHPIDFKGRGGTKLHDLWAKDGARSYLGLALPGMPNLFTMYGPNGAPRTGAFFSWAEVWSRYIAEGMIAVIESGEKAIEVKREVYDDYNAELDRQNVDLLYEQEGRGGYFVNEFGRSSETMPWKIHDYHDRIRSIDLSDYTIS